MASATIRQPRTAACAAPIAAATMGDLMRYARTAPDLPSLSDMFARMVSADGVESHACFTLGKGGAPELLFGDASALTGAALRIALECVRANARFADRSDICGSLILRTEHWHGMPLFVHLAGGVRTLARERRARLQGLTEVYSTFGIALLERESDVPTSVGLGLHQRHALALLLGGKHDHEIAEILEITPLALRGLLDSALDTIGVDTRAEAIAFAARRGWLASLVNLDDKRIHFGTN